MLSQSFAHMASRFAHALIKIYPTMLGILLLFQYASQPEQFNEGNTAILLLNM